jgi:PEP-CTERM motif
VSLRQRNGGNKLMIHKLATVIMVLVGIGFTLAPQANAAVFTFQENGSNLNLGPTSTFTQDGISLTASGFLTNGTPSDLFAKSEGAGEVGLGMTHDPSGDNEITTDAFVQLTLPTTPPNPFQLIIAGSVTGTETELVYFTPTAGTLTGATLIGTITSTDGFVTIPGNFQTGFIDVTAGAGNVLLASATVVPEPATLAFLGIGLALTGIVHLRRHLRPQS